MCGSSSSASGTSSSGGPTSRRVRCRVARGISSSTPSPPGRSAPTRWSAGTAPGSTRRREATEKPRGDSASIRARHGIGSTAPGSRPSVTATAPRTEPHDPAPPRERPVVSARLVALGTGLTLASLAASVTGPSLARPDAATGDGRLAGHARGVVTYRAGLRDVVAYVDARPDLFTRDPSGPVTLPPREARDAVRAAWQRFLDYLLALDTIGREHQRFAELPAPARDRSFAIGHAAYVAEYRFALELFDRLDRNPDLKPLLNDAVPELGLPRGTYTHVRGRFLNLARGTEFAALGVVAQSLSPGQPMELAATIREDRAAIWRYARGRGETLTVATAVEILRRAAFAGWFPVQAGIAVWMGDTRLGPRARVQVTPAQVAALGSMLEPGDILLVRRETDLANIGVPGFWPHAVLYVGTAEERRRLLVGPAVAAWVEARGQADGDFETLLARTYPAAYARSLERDEQLPRRTLEAISPGVVFRSLERAARADSVAALRPRLPAVEKAEAILRAFGYAGRPYDF